MKLYYICIYIYLLLKPYYIFRSGTLQISDLFILLSFILLILSGKEKLRNLINNNKSFLFFIILICFINLIYFIIYMEFKFLLSSLYFIFNFMAILVFINACNNNKKFLKVINKILKFNILIQLFICLTNLGRVYDSYRYMGTFNDPNQFGYYVLLSFCYIFLISKKYKQFHSIFLFLVISIFLIFKSSSTGMLFGICSFLLIYMFNFFTRLPHYIKKYGGFIVIFLLFTFFSIFLFIGLKPSNKLQFDKINNIYIIQRILDKINRIDANPKSTEQWTILEERGIDKIYLYPKYILYGAGEGKYDRFVKAAHNNEIHSTFPSILFYYGIFPFIFLINWIFNKMKGIKKATLIPYISLFLESFTLLNQRQSLFWVIIAIQKYLCNFEEEVIK